MIKSFLLIVLIFMMQACSIKSAQKEASTQDALNKQLYNLVHKLQKRVDNISNSTSSEELAQIRQEIAYHEQVLTALIQDVGALREQELVARGQEIIIQSEPSLSGAMEQFEPKTFRLIRRSTVLNENNEIIAVWKKGKSFTSYIKKGEYLKVTGLFTNKKWVKTEEDLWINNKDAKER